MTYKNPVPVTTLKSVSTTVLFMSIFSITALFASSAYAETSSTATEVSPAIVETSAEVTVDTTTVIATDEVIADLAATTATAPTQDAPETTEETVFAATAIMSTVADSSVTIQNVPLTLIASAITCATEADLPNWGNGGPSINASTAASYVVTHPSCSLVSGWNFQWGFGSKSGQSGVIDPGRDFIGAVSPVSSSYNSWKSFGPTNAVGITTVEISNLEGASRIWLREQLPAGYMPFSEAKSGIKAVGQKNNVSAETYCASDVLNFDNYDAIENPQLSTIYHCITFNVLANNTGGNTNTPPVITIIGNNPLTITVNTNFTDPGATSSDAQDGDLTSQITASSSVSTTTVGTYEIVYSVTDSGGLSTSSTRIVNVVASNTGGNTNTPPVITIVGNNPETINVGSSYVDAGATATDAQDGDITNKIIATGTVATTTVGTYVITYTVTDSGGLTSTSTRTVNVIDPNTNTGGNGGNGGNGGGGPNIGFGGGGGGGGAFAGTFGTGGIGNLTATGLSCPLLRDFLRIDFNNDPTEVVKLQGFLQRIEGLDIDVNGIFDQKTLAGVNSFQTKYLTQVMGPWGASRASGYVYITTKKKINEIACAQAFVINSAEQVIIDAYKASQNGAEFNNGIDNATGTSDIGSATGSSTIASTDSLNNNPNTAAIGNASILARFWDFLKNLFGVN